MKINVITIFPQMFESWSKCGLIGQAIQKGLIDLNFVNPRDFTEDKHRTVDDRPFGGGDGMVLLYEPLSRAIESLKTEGRLGRLVYMSPQGKTLTSDWARKAAQTSLPMTFIAGRYGGIDQRIIEEYVDEEISVGDYILSGGELPAMSVIDVMGRFIPGVLGNEASSEDESFKDGLLEAPLFTRPAELGSYLVPEILRGGHHEKIEEFRRHLSFVISYLKRPELVAERNDEVSRSAKYLQSLKDTELQSCGLSRETLLKIQNEASHGQ